MKKLVLMFVAIAAMSFASCDGSKNEAPAADSTADSTAVSDSTASDSTASDSTATPAADTTAQAK